MKSLEARQVTGNRSDGIAAVIYLWDTGEGKTSNSKGMNRSSRVERKRSVLTAIPQKFRNWPLLSRSQKICTGEKGAGKDGKHRE